MAESPLSTHIRLYSILTGIYNSDNTFGRFYVYGIHGGSAMQKALLSAFIVLVCGFLGGFLGLPGCFMATTASATGCIVYAITSHKEG